MEFGTEKKDFESIGLNPERHTIQVDLGEQADGAECLNRSPNDASVEVCGVDDVDDGYRNGYFEKGRGLMQFRSRARRIISAKRLAQSRSSSPTSAFNVADHELPFSNGPPETFSATGEVGAAAGIDFGRIKSPLHLIGEYANVHSECQITISDVSKERCEMHHHIDNHSLGSFLALERPSWAKLRWINVRGLSFDVIRTIAERYELHPLVVEDMLHIPQRIKSDLYEGLLYISMTLITLKQSNAAADGGERLQSLLDRALLDESVRHIDHSTSGSKAEHSSTAVDSAEGRLASSGVPSRKGKKLQRKRLPKRKLTNLVSSKSLATQRHKERISIEQVSILLLKHGTVLTVFEKSGQVVTLPVLKRLATAKTLLRDSEDASFLTNAIIDGIIDHAMPVMSSYANDIEQQEFLCVSNPVAASIPDLHLLRSELRILRQLLEPTQHLIHSLRSRAREMANDDRYSSISPLTRTYLSDIGDHINTVVENINALIVECTDLIDLVFNSISRSSNDSMKALTITSILILPLSFCSSIFGTNFEHLQLYKNPNGFIIFWMICLAVTLLFICIIRFLPMFTRYHK